MASSKQLEFSVLALDQASRSFVQMGKAVERFNKKLDEIDGRSLDVEAKIDTKKAEAQLGAFARDTRKKLEAAFKALPQLELTADSSDVDRDIARIRNELEALHGQRVGVDIDSTAFLAEVHRLEQELDHLGATSGDVQVRADTAAAMAQLATVRREAEALDGKDVAVDVDVDDHGSAAKAATEMSTLQRLALAAAAAVPLIGAGVVALPGLLAAAAVPAAAVLTGLEGIKQAAAALAPQFRQVQVAVSAAFVTGLAPAMNNLATLFPAVQTGLRGTATALSSIATQVTGVVSSAAGLRQLQAIFDGVNRVVTSLAPAMATLVANTMSLAQGALAGLQPLGRVLQDVGQRWSEVIAQMNASGTTQAAVSGLVSVLGGLLNVLPPIVQAGAQLMAVIGPPLAGALNAVASVLGVLTGPLGGVTTAVIAMVAAWKATSVAVALASSGLSKLATGWSTVQASLTGTTTAAAGAAAATSASGAAAAGAAAGASRLSGVMGKLGSALPIVGSALALVAVAASDSGVAFDDFVQKVSTGALSLAQAMRQASDQATSGFTGFVNWLEGDSDAGVKAMDELRQKVDEYRASLSPMAQLQFDAARAQAEFNDAVVQYGPASAQAAAAQQKKAAADAAVAKAARDAAEAAKSYNEAIRDQIASVQTALGAELDVENAMADVADATKAANDAAREHGAASKEAADANRQLGAAVDQAAQAAQKKAQADAEAMGATNAADIGVQAYAQSLLSQAATMTGPARDAVLKYVAGLNDAQLAALSAAADASGFATTLLTLPDGRTVKIAVDPETGKIVTTQQLLDNLHDKTVVIDGDTVPVETAFSRVLGAIALGQASVTINGQTMPADQALQTLLSKVDISSATATINGQSVPAQQALDAYLHAVDTGSGTATINGQSVPAEQVLAALLGLFDTSSGTSHLKAEDSAARGTANDFYNSQNGRVIVFRIRTIVEQTSHIAQGGKTLATGGVLKPMAEGGVLHNAAGRHVRPMAARATVVPPNTWRVVGDNMRVPEVYAPLDGSQRSLGFLQYGANAFGYDLVRRGMPPGGQAPPAVSAAVGTVRGSSAPTAGDMHVHVTFNSTVPPSSVEMRRQIAFLHEELRKYGRESR